MSHGDGRLGSSVLTRVVVGIHDNVVAMGRDSDRLNFESWGDKWMA